jgi:ankyrin repeat protein
MEGDVLALSELIGLGAIIDLADSNGHTSLHLATLEMVKVKSPGVLIFSKACGAYMRATDKERFFHQLAWVLHILIEQHANINIMAGGDTLIDLTCKWKDWDIVTLLLKHGATTSLITSSLFRSSADKKHFSNLLKLSGSGGTQLLQICPCWSGKVISDCHG